MIKLLTHHSNLTFVVAGLLVITTFLTATNFLQLTIAVALYPILMFFGYKMYTYKPKVLSRDEAETSKAEAQASTTDDVKKPAERVIISDIDKRVFLKLIGSAGVFLFLFSLFNRKAENLFYKSLPNKGKEYFDQREASGKETAAQTTEEYGISEIDSGESSYYGYTKLGGAWYIMKVDTDTNSFRYVRGDSNFPVSWKNREKLKYDYFGNVF